MHPQTRSNNQATRSSNQRPSALTTGQLAAVIGIGVAFWFAAAMTVLFGAPVGLFGPTASLLLFAISVPICWLSVLMVKGVARLEAGQTLPGVAVGLIAATFCDAIALTWGRSLYGSDPAQVTLGAAWILWGVGLFLLFAYLDDYHRAGAAH